MASFVMSRPACSCAHPDRERCRFCVAWAINPHMRVGAVDPARACAQHAVFAAALRRAGARVLLLPFLHGAFDSVFVKDSAILVERDGRTRALPTTFRHRERAAEAATRAAQLRRAGFAVGEPLGCLLEGGDVLAIPHRRLALFGHGVRSHRDAAPGLARFLDCEVVSLEIRDPRLFHLDTALTVLADDTLVYCRSAFTPASLRALARLRFARAVAVDDAIALRFGLNVVEVGGAIVTGSTDPRDARVWAELGRRTIATPLDQFVLAGGSAACLTARVTVLGSAAGDQRADVPVEQLAAVA